MYVPIKVRNKVVNRLPERHRLDPRNQARRISADGAAHGQQSREHADPAGL
jgi:hypothetical protein